MVYPTDTNDIEECFGDNGLLNCFKENKKRGYIEYSYKDSIKDKYGEFFHKDLLNKYSCKIKSILDIIQNSEGIIFIYSKQDPKSDPNI